MYFAVIDRYLTNDVKPNSLVVREKYRFSDQKEARYFVNTIKNVDRRVVAAKIEVGTD